MAKNSKKKWVNLYRGEEIVRWVADSKTRRVPVFVIEKTGLKTKTKVEAKYGYGAVFDKTENGSAKLVARGTRD